MSLKGGGKSPFKQAEEGIRNTARKWKNDPMAAFTDLAVTAASAGNVGYKDGGFQEGVSLRNYDEFVGSIDGRNMARKVGYETEQKLREAEIKAGVDLANERLQAYRTDMMASRSAQGIRNTAAARARGGGGGGIGSSMFDGEREFLGI